MTPSACPSLQHPHRVQHPLMSSSCAMVAWAMCRPRSRTPWRALPLRPWYPPWARAANHAPPPNLPQPVRPQTLLQPHLPFRLRQPTQLGRTSRTGIPKRKGRTLTTQASGHLRSGPYGNSGGNSGAGARRLLHRHSVWKMRQNCPFPMQIGTHTYPSAG